MRFHIAVIEPQGYLYGHFLDDGIRLILYALESLGHDCTIGLNEVVRDRLNIVWGGHCLNHLSDVEAIAAAGPYIAIHSEVLRPNGLNAWQNRDVVDQVYLPFLHGAVAIWDGKAESLAGLRDMGFPAFLLRGGYHPRFEEIVHKQEKDLDFSFFGSVTPHRAMLFEALRQRGYHVQILFDARKLYRDDLIARTKINLAPLQSLEINQLAWQRVGYLICNRGLCVVERASDQSWLEHCFPCADTEQFVDLCIETLLRSDRDALVEQYYEQYRKIRLEDGMEQLLDECLGSRPHVLGPRWDVSGVSAARSSVPAAGR